ncbi:hypothetical protein ANANG_G00175990 [Anguilla anguilla]|uniref:Uncharacterized protein n=1 Tax=Anguilla anguilla TaxID=7936 RepID=A0A9D3M4C6_ANGAN|nr:hypothetical protein ANANG_G00175990 [Anguilla anguilla]
MGLWAPWPPPEGPASLNTRRRVSTALAPLYKVKTMSCSVSATADPQPQSGSRLAHVTTQLLPLLSLAWEREAEAAPDPLTKDTSVETLASIWACSQDLLRLPQSLTVRTTGSASA